MFSWSVWQIPLEAAACSALVIGLVAFLPLVFDQWRLRRRERDWWQTWEEDPVSQFRRELDAWDGVVPAWLRISSYGNREER